MEFNKEEEEEEEIYHQSLLRAKHVKSKQRKSCSNSLKVFFFKKENKGKK